MILIDVEPIPLALEMDLLCYVDSALKVEMTFTLAATMNSSHRLRRVEKLYTEEQWMATSFQSSLILFYYMDEVRCLVMHRHIDVLSFTSP